MLCRRARNWISLSMDGELPPDRTVALTEHLERCETCRAYRSDLQVGRRLIAATAPELSDNFEWRLQLKLSQTLQGAARSLDYPLAPAAPGLGRWLTMAGGAAAAGVAIILVASSLLLQPGIPSPPLNGGAQLADGPSVPASTVASTTPAADDGDRGSVTSTAGAASRIPFISGGMVPPWRGRSGGGLLGEPVNALSGGVWSGTSINDLRTITSLREENQRLRAALSVAQREVEFMKAQLDTSGRGGTRQDQR